MGTSLNGLTPANTYTGLLKFGDNSALTSTLKTISDGAGNDTMLELSTTALQIGGSTGIYWNNTNKRLGIGTNIPSVSFEVQSNAPGGLIGKMQNSDPGGFGLELRAGSGVTQYAFQWSNFGGGGGGRLYPSGVYIGQQSIPSARLQIKGSGSTSATTSLLVQNSSDLSILTCRDDRRVDVGGEFHTSGSVNSGFGINSDRMINNGASTGFVNEVSFGSGVATPRFEQVNATFKSFYSVNSFTASSGSGGINAFVAENTINQTGSASGITRGLYINPTLTSAVDYRAIETTNGKIIFGNLPTSSSGLVSGQLWNDGGTLKIA